MNEPVDGPPAIAAVPITGRIEGVAERNINSPRMQPLRQ